MSRNCSARSAHLNPTYSTFYNHDFCPILMQNYSFFGLLFFFGKDWNLTEKNATKQTFICQIKVHRG